VGHEEVVSRVQRRLPVDHGWVIFVGVIVVIL